MSKIALSGNPSGTGTLTIAAPNTNSDATINLPTITGGEFIVSNASGNVGIGTSTPGAKFHVDGGAASTYMRVSNTASTNGLYVGLDGVGDSLISAVDAKALRFSTTNIVRARIDPDGAQSSVIPGGTVLYPEFKCRAWVNFDGTTAPGTIRASGNVSSVTRNATGDYTVNFATAMPDASYSFTSSGMYAVSDDASAGAQSFNARQSFPPTASALRGMWKQGNDSTPRNSSVICISVFR